MSPKWFLYLTVLVVLSGVSPTQGFDAKQQLGPDANRPDFGAVYLVGSQIDLSEGPEDDSESCGFLVNGNVFVVSQTVDVVGGRWVAAGCGWLHYEDFVGFPGQIQFVKQGNVGSTTGPEIGSTIVVNVGQLRRRVGPGTEFGPCAHEFLRRNFTLTVGLVWSSDDGRQVWLQEEDCFSAYRIGNVIYWREVVVPTPTRTPTLTPSRTATATRTNTPTFIPTQTPTVRATQTPRPTLDPSTEREPRPGDVFVSTVEVEYRGEPNRNLAGCDSFLTENVGVTALRLEFVGKFGESGSQVWLYAGGDCGWLPLVLDGQLVLRLSRESDWPVIGDRWRVVVDQGFVLPVYDRRTNSWCGSLMSGDEVVVRAVLPTQSFLVWLEIGSEKLDVDCSRVMWRIGVVDYLSGPVEQVTVTPSRVTSPTREVTTTPTPTFTSTPTPTATMTPTLTPSATPDCFILLENRAYGLQELESMVRVLRERGCS